MSNKGYLVIDTGGPEPARVDELGDYTSNASRMWTTALRAAGEDIRLSDTDGRIAAEVLPLLRAAVSHMESHENLYPSMNPPWDWAGYASALIYLRGVVTSCEAHPKATLSWST